MISPVSHFFDINIYSDPLTQEQINERRKAIARTPSLGEKIVLYSPPMLGLELIPALAAEAISLAVHGDPLEPWKACRGANARDWSGSIFTQSFVDKVRAANRDLVNAEVAALERHLELETTARSVAGTIGTSFMEYFKSKN